MNNQNSKAKMRWKLLAEILKRRNGNNEINFELEKVSIRKFNTFNLINYERILMENDDEIINCKIKINEQKLYELFICQPFKKYTTREDLSTPQDNTGNICIWASEEILTFYLLSNLDSLKDAVILELGGGLCSLAGLISAKYSDATLIHLTDGNLNCVNNINKSINLNHFNKAIVKCFRLKWNENLDIVKNFLIKDLAKASKTLLTTQYSIILCADCIFFDESREDLIETIWKLLSANGYALIMAPKRGTTMQQFIILASLRGFACYKMYYYNEIVWTIHLNYLENFQLDYNENIHYPILLKLIKIKI